MDKLMDSPWFLRFTALFLAIILFISIKGEEGEINGKTPGDQQEILRDVPVKAYYDNENLIVTGVPETVNMTIDGPTNIVQTTLLLKDFTLFVDLNDLTMGKHRIEIQHENMSEKLQVRFDPAMIDIVIEEKITQTFRVEPELNSRLLAEDFHVVKMEVEPTRVEVTGAKSVIEAISFVKVTATGDEGINESFEQKARVRVLDKDLNKMNVVISPEEVSVKVEVAEYSKEVPIVLEQQGTPPFGVNIESITTTESKVILFGPRKTLDGIEEITVDVDVSKINGPETIDINLKKPQGISTMSIESVKVKIEAKEIEFDDDTAFSDEPGDPEKQTGIKRFENISIEVNGLDDQYSSSFLQPEMGLITLVVRAELDLIEAIQKSDFVVYVNADEAIAEGEHVLAIQVDGPDNVSWLLSVDEATMLIKLT